MPSTLATPALPSPSPPLVMATRPPAPTQQGLFAGPTPPAFTTSFKSVLPPINLTKVRDYRKIPFDDLDKIKFYLYMPAASFCVRTITHPLTVVKTRMQTGAMNNVVSTFPSTASPYASAAAANPASPASASAEAAKQRIRPYQRLPVDLSNKTTFGALKYILEYEGFKGLYAGFGVAVLGLVVGPLYMTSLETTRTSLYSYGLQHKLPVDIVPFLAGAAASCISQVLAVPIDVLSNRKMAGRSQGVAAIMKNIQQIQGISGLYRGYW
jgi:hypothetical protein